MADLRALRQSVQLNREVLRIRNMDRIEIRNNSIVPVELKTDRALLAEHSKGLQVDDELIDGAGGVAPVSVSVMDTEAHGDDDMRELVHNTQATRRVKFIGSGSDNSSASPWPPDMDTKDITPIENALDCTPAQKTDTLQ